MTEEQANELADFLDVAELTPVVTGTGEDQYVVELHIAGVLYYTIQHWTSTED